MCQSVAHDDCVLEVGAPFKEASRAGAAGARRCRAGESPLTHDVLAFDVDLEQPIDFAAGQFALLTVPGIVGARAYSMVNFERRARAPVVRGEEEARRGRERAALGRRDRRGAPRRVRAHGTRDLRARRATPPAVRRRRQRHRRDDVDPVAGLPGRSLRGLGRPRLLRRAHRPRRVLPGRAGGAAGARPRTGWPSPWRSPTRTCRSR